MPLIGYARVSTRDQDLAGNWPSLKPSDVSGAITRRKGRRSDRPQLRKVISRLEARDVLVVTRLDRLAGATRDFSTLSHDLTARTRASDA